METVPPFDWSEIARSSEMATRFDRVDVGFEQVDRRLDGLRDELHSMGRTVAIGAVGFTLSMVLATGTMLGTVVASGALS